MKITTAILACACVFLLTSCATPLEEGNAFYGQGKYDQAIQKWNIDATKGNMYAQYNVGMIWEGGLGSTPKNKEIASQWYSKSAVQGFVPAMVSLANLQYDAGFKKPALSWLKLAARWGDQNAVRRLRMIGETPPYPDLLQSQMQANAQVQRIRDENTTRVLRQWGNEIEQQNREKKMRNNALITQSSQNAFRNDVLSQQNELLQSQKKMNNQLQRMQRNQRYGY